MKKLEQRVSDAERQIQLNELQIARQERITQARRGDNKAIRDIVAGLSDQLEKVFEILDEIYLPEEETN